MVTAEQRVGRLIEIRWSLPITAEDGRIFAQRATEMLRDPIPKCVCIDARAVRVFPVALTDLMQSLMKQDTSHALFRTAILLAPGNAVASLQQTRMMLEVPDAKERARLFQDPDELRAWLIQWLEPEEQRQLAEFLRAS